MIVCTGAHGCLLDSSPLPIEHLAFMVYIRMQWRPKRYVHKSSTAPYELWIHIPNPGTSQFWLLLLGQTMDATFHMESRA